VVARHRRLTHSQPSFAVNFSAYSVNTIVERLDAIFSQIPLPLLEVWGRFGYIIGFALMLAAFGGFVFRPGGRWGFGREQQAWDAKALLASALTCILVIVTGYIGSFIVLVPGPRLSNR